MKDEYDFSQAVRGKFFRKNLQLIPPLRLEPEVLSFLATKAEKNGTTINQLLNQLLKEDMRELATAD